MAADRIDADAALSDAGQSGTSVSDDEVFIVTPPSGGIVLDAGSTDACVMKPGKCVPFFVGMEKCQWQTGSCFYLGARTPDDEPVDNEPSEERTDTMPLPPGFPPPAAPRAARVEPPVLPMDLGVAPSVVPAGVPMVPAIPSGIPTPNIPGGGGLFANSVPGTPQPNLIPQAVGQPMVGMPTSAASEFQNLPTGSAISPLTVVLALVAVGGGATAWKFYSQRSKEKHEENMKKLDNEGTSSSQRSDDDRKNCEARGEACVKRDKALEDKAEEHARKLTVLSENVEALTKQLRAAEEQVAKAARKAAEIEELDERLQLVERKLKTTAAPAKAEEPSRKRGRPRKADTKEG